MVRDGGSGTRGEDEDFAVHWCSSSDEVFDEGATGDDFPACAVVAGRDVAAAEWVGAEEREEEIRVRV